MWPLHSEFAPSESSPQPADSGIAPSNYSPGEAAGIEIIEAGNALRSRVWERLDEEGGYFHSHV